MQMACECGYVARGADDGELVADAQTHARDVHRIDLTEAMVRAAARSAAAHDHRLWPPDATA